MIHPQTLPSPSLSLMDQLSRSILFGKLESLKDGCLIITEEYHSPARSYAFGPENAPLRATLRIHDPRAYQRMVFSGSIGAGESYMDGEWDSAELTNLVRIFVRNRETLQQIDHSWTAIASPLQKWFHRLRKNTIEGAEKNIHEHYDLGNDFFELFLDSTWMYSSAVFPTDAYTLEEGQVEKIDRICRKLKLKPEDHLLEIGTGWGGFALHAAQKYGCRVTTTTISKEQYKLARERVQKAGLQDRVEVLFQDYRLLEGVYDKIVSIEMIESVGLEYLDEYFAKCSSLLKPEGEMCIQAITIRDHLYDHASRNVDFIQRYIFPGSGIPSVSAMSSSIAEQTDLQMNHLEDFGIHYARTLHEWADRLAANHDEMIARGYPERLYRMWQFYFSYCEGGFLERSIGVSQLVLSKPQAKVDVCKVS